MVYHTYQFRQIEESNRAKWEGWAQAKDERGDFDEAQGTRDFLKKWEEEQGQEKEELVCPTCQRRWLTPTARGTLRPTPDGMSLSHLGAGAPAAHGHPCT